MNPEKILFTRRNNNDCLLYSKRCRAMDTKNSNPKIDDVFNIRYVKLKFTVSLLEECVLPKYKASMIRGGIGEMLLRANCVCDRNCEKCDFESECIVQRTMYSKFNSKPEFVTEGDSIGYVLECESKQTEFCSGEQFSFYLVLFGKTIVYFSQYLNAIYALGSYGIGKDNARYRLVSVQNSRGKDILVGNDIFMKYYQVENLKDYVDHRLAKLGINGEMPESLAVTFFSPMSIKYNGEMLESFNAEALIRALARRIYLMNCFEENDVQRIDARELASPVISSQNYRNVSVPRFSNRKQQKIYLHGVVGEAVLTGVTEETLKILLAGEVLHAGKNTSFGFGRYMTERTE